MSTHKRVTVDCYLRGSMFAGLIADTISALREHNKAGTIDALTVDVWPDEVRLSDGGAGEPVVERYNRFLEWAGEHGVSLEPAFRRTERTVPVIDTTETVLELPVVCLTVRIGGEIEIVAPHSTEHTTYTVEDAIADINAGRVRETGQRGPTSLRSSDGDDSARVQDSTSQRSD